jgi:hypothetical protein
VGHVGHNLDAAIANAREPPARLGERVIEIRIGAECEFHLDFLTTETQKHREERIDFFSVLLCFCG